MTASEAVAERLADIAGVTALVGARIYLLTVPEHGDFPAIRVQEISQDEGAHLRGSSGQRQSRVQVDYFAEVGNGNDPFADARDVEEAGHGDGAGSGLAFYSGRVGSPACVIDLIRPAGRREAYDPEERRIVRIIREYFVHWKA